MEPSAASDPARRNWVRRWLNRMEVDRAVFFAVSQRVWQLSGGVVTALLITVFFSCAEQDYYFTFASLIALQTFFELGFHIVIVNVCSHEWTRLRLTGRGRLAGDRDALSRLVSLGRLLFVWYGVASFLFAVAVGAGGAWFLAQRTEALVVWQSPWLVQVCLSAFLLWTLPFNAVLEGCNQVAAVNLFRLIQAVTASLAVWLVMTAGGGLWAAVAATAARLGCDLFFLLIHYRHFFRSFLRPPSGPHVDWFGEIWPLQWRLGLGAVFSYFAFFLFVPVMYRYHEEGLAGQMGMTWTVVTAIQAAALAWVQTRVPRFGMLVRQRDFAELDRVFFRVSAFGLAAMLLAGTAFGSAVWLLDAGQFRMAQRLLEPLPTGIFLLAAILQWGAAVLAYYVRAHKQEPFLLTSILSNVSIGAAVWQLGARFGPLGAACGLLGVMALFTLPAHLLLWHRCRAER